MIIELLESFDPHTICQYRNLLVHLDIVSTSDQANRKFHANYSIVAIQMRHVKVILVAPHRLTYDLFSVFFQNLYECN